MSSDAIPRNIPVEQAEYMLRVKNSLALYYVSAPLYVQIVGGDFHLYKAAGASLEDVAKAQGHLPRQLHIRQQDKVDSIPEVQAGVSQRLGRIIERGPSESVKLLLSDMVEESFQDPRAESFKGLGPVVKVLVDQYQQRGPAIRELALLVNKNYGTAVHAVNVAALTLAYCFKNGFSVEVTAEYGLAAMLHDIGKLAIDDDILNAPRPLTGEEFAIIKSHPEAGLRLVTDQGFSRLVEEAILEHHERLDGKGYPRGRRRISLAGRLIGIIDSYEALTSDERPYRKPLGVLQALELMNGEVKQGKFDQGLFKSFAYCLV